MINLKDYIHVKVNSQGCPGPDLQAQTFCKPCQFVFIVGHQRSGSTLLTHILSSHPNVTGYGETLMHYKSARDLNRLVHATSVVNRRVLVRPYALDKVLHNDLLCDAILRDERCRFIFLLRQPDRAIQSHIRQMVAWNTHPNMGPEDRQSSAFNYYESRLPMVEQEALGIDDTRRRVFLTHDQLMGRTSEVFRMLEDFLDLDTPLTERYSLTRRTGAFGSGDTSQYIRSGFIDRAIEHESMAMPDWILDRSNELHLRLTARLSSLCRCLAPTKTEPLEALTGDATSIRST